MGRYKQATQVEELLVDEHPGLVKETCLMIACHKSCLTRDRMTTFRRTVQNAMRVFPASAIFVCDNGPTPHPVDRTQEVCRELSRETYPDGSQEVQYLYVPEVRPLKPAATAAPCTHGSVMTRHVGVRRATSRTPCTGRPSTGSPSS